MSWLSDFAGFSTLLDIDKLTRGSLSTCAATCFSTLLDIDKLTPGVLPEGCPVCFSTLLDIDKLTPLTSPCHHWQQF